MMSYWKQISFTDLPGGRFAGNASGIPLIGYSHRIAEISPFSDLQKLRQNRIIATPTELIDLHLGFKASLLSLLNLTDCSASTLMLQCRMGDNFLIRQLSTNLVGHCDSLL